MVRLSRSASCLRDGTSNNIFTAHPGLSRGGFSFVYALVFPSCSTPLVWPPMAHRRHYCAHVRQSGADRKKQRRKGHLQTLHGVLSLCSVSVYPIAPNGIYRLSERPTAHKATPTRSAWSRTGYCHLLRARYRTAQRGPSHSPPIYSTRGGSPSA